MKFKFYFILISIFLLFNFSVFSESRIKQSDIKVELPEIIVSDINSKISFTITNEELASELDNKSILIKINGKRFSAIVEKSTVSVNYIFKDKGVIKIAVDDFQFAKKVNPIPLWFSIIPPLIAIFIALLFKEVFTALIIGLLCGTSIIAFYQGGNIFEAVFVGFLAIIDTYVIESLTKPDHMAIIVFSMLIGAMVFCLIFFCLFKSFSFFCDNMK